MEFVRKYSPFEEAWTVTGWSGNEGCGAACRLDTMSLWSVITASKEAINV
jgi:hypothetical protein